MTVPSLHELPLWEVNRFDDDSGLNYGFCFNITYEETSQSMGGGRPRPWTAAAPEELEDVSLETSALPGLQPGHGGRVLHRQRPYLTS